jgi:hypothetical protein
MKGKIKGKEDLCDYVLNHEEVKELAGYISLVH